MKQTTKKQLFFSLFICALFVLFVAVFVWYFFGSSTNNASTTSSDTLFVADYAAQEEIEAAMQSAADSGEYTAESPLIILDPYGQSPLTAVIIFSSDSPTTTAITVAGKTTQTTVYQEFSDCSTSHIVPVYALYADTDNVVTLTVYDESGAQLSSTQHIITTAALPSGFDYVTILTETFQDTYQEGLTYCYSESNTGCKFAFDQDGDIRWYLTISSLTTMGCEFNYTDDHFIFSSGSTTQGDISFIEVDKFGKIYNVWYAPYGCHHDISVMPNGNLLVLGANTETLDTIEDFIYEIDCVTGEIVNTLDLKDVLQRMKIAYAPLTGIGTIGATDWCHLNSIEYDESDGTIVISSNFQSAIIKIDWETKDIIWMMSDEDGWSARLSQYLLTPTDADDDFEYTYNQHAVEILPDLDGDPDTIDIMVFDNGSTRFVQDEELQEQIALGLAVEPDLYSRLVHYRINEVTMEVEQIWQYGKEEGLCLYSAIVGDADYLENGNVLGTFDKHTWQNSEIIGSPTIVEVDANGDEVWTAELFLTTGNGSTATYRNERLSFYGDSEGELNFAS